MTVNYIRILFCTLVTFYSVQNSRNCFVLTRKRRKLVAQLSALISRNPSSPGIRSIDVEIDMTHFHIKVTFNVEYLRQEKLAVTKITVISPSFSVSYATRFAKSKSPTLVHCSITAIYPTIPRKWPTSSKFITS